MYNLQTPVELSCPTPSAFCDDFSPHHRRARREESYRAPGHDDASEDLQA
jgi:hypothetical protein